MDVKLKSKIVGVGLLILVIIAFALPDRRGLNSIDLSYAGEWVSPMTLLFEEIFDSVDHHASSHISIYDEIFREVSLSMGNDWRLMAAISYVESRFRYDIRSNTGAVGLMQIMPRMGRHYGCDVVQLLDPRINITVANLLYDDIERMLKMPKESPERDKISLALACYNGGIGHLYDAQRLTRRAGQDPHRWGDVAPHLRSLRREEIYTDSLVRHGSFKSAGWTIRYVRDVLEKYDEYVHRTSSQRLHLYPYATRFDNIEISM